MSNLLSQHVACNRPPCECGHRLVLAIKVWDDARRDPAQAQLTKISEVIKRLLEPGCQTRR